MIRLTEAWLYECPDCEGQRVMVNFETELGRVGESIVRWCACDPVGKLFDFADAPRAGDLKPEKS